MKKIGLFLLILFLIFITSCKEKSFDDKFKTIKVGYSYDKVVEILGKEEDSDEFNNNEEYYKVLYWFKGDISTISQAEVVYKKRNIPTKYYCIILKSTDMINYKIEEKEDIFTSSWGVK